MNLLLREKQGCKDSVAIFVAVVAGGEVEHGVELGDEVVDVEALSHAADKC